MERRLVHRRVICGRVQSGSSRATQRARHRYPNVKSIVTSIARAAAIVVGCASALTAQAAPRPSGSGVLITGRDMGLFAGATAATALLSRADVRIARTLSDSGFHARHPGWTTAAKRTS